MKNSELKIAVLAGGIGSERDISIQSGRGVAEALQEAGFDVVTADIRPDNLDIFQDDSIDVFFPALHGEFGEDGRLQQILEDKSLLYTGSGPQACKLAFDKMASKKIFNEAGIITPKAIEFDADTDIRQLEQQLRNLADEYIIKPVRQGSSVGLNIADDWREAVAAAQEILNEFGDCMIEELIPGRDITIGILCGQALPIIELHTKTGFYDYHAKYSDNKTEFLFDTIENAAVAARASAVAMNCFNALGCRHFARVDFRLDNDGMAYALELNAIPGFTARSDLPKAADNAGISMSELCTKIVKTAYSSLVKDQA